MNGDWVTYVKNDLKEIKLNLSFTEISEFPKHKFKALVKKSMKQSCFETLMKDKKRLSKGSEIDYDSFQTRKYLLSGTGFSSDSMKLIFSVRSRDLAVRGNFANSHKELKCVVKECPEKIESQYHLFSCPFLASSDEVVPNDLSYDDIFANNVRKQFQLMEIRLKRRNEYDKTAVMTAHLIRGLNL